MPLKNCFEKYSSLLRFMLFTALNQLAILVIGAIALAGVSRIPGQQDLHTLGPAFNVTSPEKESQEVNYVVGMNQDDPKKDENEKEAGTSKENKKSKDEPPPPVCKDVEMGPSGTQEVVVSTLSRIGDIKVYVAGPKHLIICGSSENVESITGVVPPLSYSDYLRHLKCEFKPV